jgi:hypothetical protein
MPHVYESLTCLQVILAIRTWAVWQRSKVVFAILAFVLFGNLVVQCVFTGLLTRYMSGASRPRAFIR